jgi:hypothetical protein
VKAGTWHTSVEALLRPIVTKSKVNYRFRDLLGAFPRHASHCGARAGSGIQNDSHIDCVKELNHKVQRE